jgi:hypothetical protein
MVTEEPKKEPSANARVAARQLWDMYQALLEEGFDERQALQLLALAISSSFRDPR